MFEQVGSDLTFYATFIAQSNGSPVTGLTPTVKFFYVDPDGTQDDVTPSDPPQGELTTTGSQPTGVYFAVLPNVVVADRGDYICVFSVNSGTLQARTIASVYNVGRAKIGIWDQDSLLNAELSAVPGVTPSLRQAIMLLYTALRNATKTESNKLTIYQDGAETVLAEAVLTDTGTQFDRGELTTPE